MSNNKQNHIGEANKMISSVDWLDKQLASLNFDYITGQVSNKEYNEKSKQILEQAKSMHKEEIKQAIMFGDCRGQIGTYATSEEYYNETFGGNK